MPFDGERKSIRRFVPPFFKRALRLQAVKRAVHFDCAERFTAIEVNSTFYRLQPQSTFEKWRDETPDGFPFAIKGHRYVTHNKKLIDVEQPVIRCHDAASPLGKRLAAVVWQLPAFFKKNIDRLDKFLQTLSRWE